MTLILPRLAPGEIIYTYVSRYSSSIQTSYNASVKNIILKAISPYVKLMIFLFHWLEIHDILIVIIDYNLLLFYYIYLYMHISFVSS